MRSANAEDPSQLASALTLNLPAGTTFNWQPSTSSRPDSLACRSNRSRRLPAINYTAITHHPLPAARNDTPLCGKLRFDTPLGGGSFVSGAHGPAFDLALCRLRRLDADAALSCFANRRIVMVGDSITRYQALSFAHWLGNGDYQHPYDADVKGHPPSYTNMRQHWLSMAESFHNASQEVSQAGCMTGVCDKCFRNKGSYDQREVYDFNYTLSSGATVSVAHMTILNHPTLIDSAIGGLEWALRSAHRPDVLIFNVGKWIIWNTASTASLTTVFSTYEVIFQRAAALVAAQVPPRTQLVFKATTPSLNQSDVSQSDRHSSWMKAWPDIEVIVRGQAQYYGFHYYDVAAVVRAALAQQVGAMWDADHFFPFAYRQFNDLLLNIMC